MDDLFDYEKCRKQKQDAFAVIGDAIRKQYPDERIPANLARVMAKIIDDGFLDCTLEQQRELIRHNKGIMLELGTKIDNYQRTFNKLSADIVFERNQLESLERKQEDIKKEIEEELKGDSDLENAKKAYLWMKTQTGQEQLASKAFDSYLIGKANRFDQRVKEKIIKKVEDIFDPEDEEEDIDFEL